VKVAAQMRNLLTWLRDEVPSLVLVRANLEDHTILIHPVDRKEFISPVSPLGGFISLSWLITFVKNCVTVSSSGSGERFGATSMGIQWFSLSNDLGEAKGPNGFPQMRG